jgi:hypothetical protein
MEVTVAEDKRTTLEKVGDILEDVADIFGLGSRVVKEASSLVNKDTAAKIADETSDRAEKIRADRKKAKEK